MRFFEAKGACEDKMKECSVTQTEHPTTFAPWLQAGLFRPCSAGQAAAWGHAPAHSLCGDLPGGAGAGHRGGGTAWG